MLFQYPRQQLGEQYARQHHSAATWASGTLLVMMMSHNPDLSAAGAGSR
jgi:hypothetical protein